MSCCQHTSHAVLCVVCASACAFVQPQQTHCCSLAGKGGVYGRLGTEWGLPASYWCAGLHAVVMTMVQFSKPGAIPTLLSLLHVDAYEMSACWSIACQGGSVHNCEFCWACGGGIRVSGGREMCVLLQPSACRAMTCWGLLLHVREELVGEGLQYVGQLELCACLHNHMIFFAHALVFCTVV
jgi:hypothetical protein